MAASTGDGADVVLPLLLTLALLALLALFMVVRNRRPSTAGDAPAAAGETRMAAAPPAAAAGAAATVQRPTVSATESTPEPQPEDETADEPEDEPQPQVEPEPTRPAAAPPASFTGATPITEPRPDPGQSHRTRNRRLGMSAAALAAGGVIRALLRVRRRR